MSHAGVLRLTDLRVNGLASPLGIDPGDLTFAWKLESDVPDTLQTRYRIHAQRNNATLWDSGVIEDGRCFAVRWGGTALAARQIIDWRVEVWDNHGNRAVAESRFETGLSGPRDWSAAFIEMAAVEDPEQRHPAALFRRGFTLAQLPVRARLYATAHGIYEARLNGRRVSDALFMPGFTNYDRRLQVQTFDVIDLLQVGENALGAIVVDGWYRGSHGSHHKTNNNGTQLALLAQLELTFQDGSTEVIGSDAAWRCGTGALRFCDMHLGALIDAGLAATGWDQAGFDAGGWQMVRVVDHDLQRLCCQEGALTRVTQEVSGIAVLTTPDGSTVIDFGQNLAGHVRFSVGGPAGHEIRMLPVETLDQMGNPWSGTTVMPEIGKKRYPRHRWTVRLSGNGVDAFDTRFTYTGFRYLAIENWPGTLTAADFTACVVHSDVRTMGQLECPDARVMRLIQNIDWSHRGNLVEIPTDCPAREKAGWTGDSYNNAGLAMLRRDMHALLRRWLKDVVIDQDKRGHGIVPCVSPNTRTYVEGIPWMDGSAGFGDAIVEVPWLLYREYGDLQVLAENYPAMCKWMDFCEGRARKRGRATWLVPGRLLNPWHWQRNRNLVTFGFHYGDWLPPGENLLFNLLRNWLITPVLAATALYARSLDRITSIARLLEHPEDAERFGRRRAEVVAAFQAEFLRRNGRLSVDKQYAYIFALHFDLLPENARQQAADRLAELIRNNGDRLHTGFFATRGLMPTLTRFGHHELAGRLLMQDRRPSWLYEVDRGATTVWESWDAIDERGKVLPASLNHFSPGIVAQWLFEHVGGLQATEPGWRRMRIAPHPTAAFTSFTAEHDTPCGIAASHWRIDDGRFVLEAKVPPNVRAEVELPGGTVREVGSGSHRFSVALPQTTARFQETAGQE